MKNIKGYQVAMLLALLFLVITLGMVIAGNAAGIGPFLIGFFIALSFGVKGYPPVKGLSFTMWMFTAVAASMFYPQLFVQWGDFKTTVLIVPLLQVIMFGMGSQMSIHDFNGVIKMPKGVVIGVGAHYIVMPLLALAITYVFKFPPEIAAGIILVGCVPSGLASNVMSLLANANLALAVTIGAITTMIAPFVTPFLMKVIGGQYVAVNIWSMMHDIIKMMILPIIAGFIFNLYYDLKVKGRARTIEMASYLAVILLTGLIILKVDNEGFSGYLVAMAKAVGIFYLLPAIVSSALRVALKGDKTAIKKALSLASMIGIAAIVTVITANGRDSLMKVGALLLIMTLLHNILGYAFGYGTAALFGMPEKDRRTIAFEVGMPNAGLASGLAMTMGNIATIGLAPAIYGPLMNVTGSTLASWWRTKPPKEDKEAEELRA